MSKNLSNTDAELMTKNLNEMFQYVYKSKVPSSKRLNVNELHVIDPKEKVKKLNVQYLKNKKQLLSYFFANIMKKPFINRSFNAYAFEALWLLLGIIDEENGNKYRQKELFANVTLMQNVANTIRFGKYIFTIPKYKQFIFDVKGYNMARLTIV